MRTGPIVVVCLLGLAACASPPTPKTERQQDVDPDTAATIHMYRPASGIVGAALQHYVYIDGVKAGRLNSNESVEVRVSPGEHEVIVLPEFIGIPNTKSLKLTVETKAKQDLYVRYSTSVASAYVVGNITNVNFNNGLQVVDKHTWDSRE